MSTEAGANSNSIVLKGSDLDALSDDPDELSSELTALAGPSAGPNGGQIYIDGFTGGQLPPKSAIREIRINQNPFSAEFDKIGYGRIEILTKPGTDTLHGRVFGQGNDNLFNTGNPFTAELPSYYSFQYNGSVSGAMSKSASFFFSVEQRDTQTDNVFYIPNGPVFDGTSDMWAISPGVVSGSLFSPANHLEVSPRVDLQLGQKNTLTMRYQFYRNNVKGSLSSTSLPSTSSNSNSLEHTVQLDDTEVINDKMVDETRFEYRRANSSSAPVTSAPGYGPAGSAPSMSVPKVFASGGDGGQTSTTHSDHLELQNYLTLSAGKQAIKIGEWLRDDREAQSTDGNFNGSFTFPSITAFVDTWNGVEAGETFADIAAACPATQAGGCLPTKLTYTSGPYAFQGNVFNAALFFQDDWTVSKLLTLSGGLRWEGQNHIADHSDWAPRVAFAYALDGHKKGTTPKTVLRGGFGFFYDRFATNNLMDLEELNGSADSQKQIVISDPTCFNGESLSMISGGRRLLRLGYGAHFGDLLHLAQLPLALSCAARHERGAPARQSGDGHVHLHAHLWFSSTGGARLERVSARRLHIQPGRAADDYRAASGSVPGHRGSILSRSGDEREPGDCEHQCTVLAEAQCAGLLRGELGEFRRRGRIEPLELL